MLATTPGSISQSLRSSVTFSAKTGLAQKVFTVPIEELVMGSPYSQL